MASAHAPTNEQQEEKDKSHTCTPAHNQSSPAECKPASFNKYVTSCSNKKDEQNISEKPDGGSQSASYLGLSFAPKSGSKNLIKRFETTEAISSARPVPSFNKYVSPLNRTNDKNQAAKNIVRSFSLRVRPTYETSNAAPMEPSINFSTKCKQNAASNNRNAEKNKNRGDSSSTSHDSDYSVGKWSCEIFSA